MDNIMNYLDKDILYIDGDKSIDQALKVMLKNNYEKCVILKEPNIKKRGNVLGVVELDDLLKSEAYNLDYNYSIKNIARDNFKEVDKKEDIEMIDEYIRTDKIFNFLVLDGEEILGCINMVSAFECVNDERYRENKKLNMILESIHEGVCVINKECIVTFWNSAAEKLYKIDKEDICGKNIKEIFPNALIVQTLEKNKTYENIKHRPNKQAQVILSTTPLVIDGIVIGAVSTDRDISEMEKLSKDLLKERGMVEELKSQVMELTQDKYHFDKIIGKSKTLTDCIKLSKKVAKTDASVLITGESGTGKEVFARAIHKESGRVGSFIPINCSAIPANLLESELFGYEEGAFTGAKKKGKPGKFELAHGGTLFLDEIGDMPVIMQAKLLRVLQDGMITRVGGEKTLEVNTRIIAATHKDLKEMMKREEFREDLYYRLNVVSVEIPALRDRREDIPDLIDSFIDEFALKNGMGDMGISLDAMKILTDYDWSGNIRQLRNTIERLVILSQENLIEVSDIPKEIVNSVNTPNFMEFKNADEIDLKDVVENFEREIIKNTLLMENGNKARVAERLNLKRSTLYYKLELYGIEK